MEIKEIKAECKSYELSATSYEWPYGTVFQMTRIICFAIAELKPCQLVN